MMIEIRKAGFINKGAELMLLSILDRLAQACPDARCTMVPTVSREGSAQPVERITRAGMYPKLSIYHWGRELAGSAALIPATLRRMYGLVLDREVDAVLDASGFSYSDQWGPRDARELAYFARRWRKRGTKLILMPQAFGPFEDAEIRRYMTSALENCDLVFARDDVSLRHLRDLVGDQPHIRQAPDFTNLLTGVTPAEFDAGRCRVALVPNYRMIDMAGEDGDYVGFMTHAARYLADEGEKPFLLVHERSSDGELARQIAASAGGLPVVEADNAREIKGILGACFATIGSRFHGLVSALSQGVPSLATGWSHKYQALFDDYGVADGLVALPADNATIERRLATLVDPDGNAACRRQLLERSQALKAQSEAMWGDVIDVLAR